MMEGLAALASVIFALAALALLPWAVVSALRPAGRRLSEEARDCSLEERCSRMPEWFSARCSSWEKCRNP